MCGRSVCIGLGIHINSRLKQHGSRAVRGTGPTFPWPCAGGRQDSHRLARSGKQLRPCRAAPRPGRWPSRPVPVRHPAFEATAFSALLYLHKREGARLPASPHPIPMPCCPAPADGELASSFGWWMHACMVSNSPTRTPPILCIRIWGSRS